MNTPTPARWPPPDILRLRDAGALFAVSHSGGKDSQAMLLRLRTVIPDQLIVVFHAHLGRVEWPGTIEHIRATIGGLPLVVATARRDLLTMTRERGRWPSPAQRQCTSDLKRGPIEREVRRWLRDRREHGGRVVSCIGLRADESPRRAHAPELARNASGSRAGRDWRTWLPIHRLSAQAVFLTIRSAGQRPHWVYEAGLSRCSCSFCFMASRADLKSAARLRPDLLAEYDAVERETGQTLVMPRRGRSPERLIDLVQD